MPLNTNLPLRYKIGQLILLGFNGHSLQPNDAIVQAILAQQIAGVILFDYNMQTKKFERNIQNPTQLKNLCAQLQDYAQQAAATHHNDLLPLLIGIDYEGGKVNRLKESYGFFKTSTAAEIGAGSIDQATHYANAMAQTLQSAGINLNFAPVIDVNVNPINPIIAKYQRSFSQDAKKVAEFASLFTHAFHEHGIISTYKHFPGHGSSTGDTHAGFVDVTQTWQPCELEPYKTLLADIPPSTMVMTAHVVHRGLDDSGLPASISTAMTQELLRKQLNFNGVVVTDDLQMGAIAKHYTIQETVRLALNAGADLLVFGNQLSDTPQSAEQLVSLIEQEVTSGHIKEARINEAFERITTLKTWLTAAQEAKNSLHSSPSTL